MISAQASLAKAKSEKDKNFYGSKVTSLDRCIDELVFRVFKLTDDERALLVPTSDRATR
jgi:hypothetical protein